VFRLTGGLSGDTYIRLLDNPGRRQVKPSGGFPRVTPQNVTGGAMEADLTEIHGLVVYGSANTETHPVCRIRLCRARSVRCGEVYLWILRGQQVDNILRHCALQPALMQHLKALSVREPAKQVSQRAGGE